MRSRRIATIIALILLITVALCSYLGFPFERTVNRAVPTAIVFNADRGEWTIEFGPPGIPLPPGCPVLTVVDGRYIDGLVIPKSAPGFSRVVMEEPMPSAEFGIVRFPMLIQPWFRGWRIVFQDRLMTAGILRRTFDTPLIVRIAIDPPGPGGPSPVPAVEGLQMDF